MALDQWHGAARAANLASADNAKRCKLPNVTRASVVGELADLAPSFLRHLRAKNRSPKTVKAYREAADQLVAFLADQGMPTDACRRATACEQITLSGPRRAGSC